MTQPGKIEIGDIVRTSYGTGPYRVVEIERDCTCPSYFEELEYMGRPGAKPSPPHIHLTLVNADVPIGSEPKQPGAKGFYWLNGYAWEGGRWLCVWRGWQGKRDELIIEGNAAGVQLQLFG